MLGACQMIHRKSKANLEDASKYDPSMIDHRRSCMLRSRTCTRRGTKHGAFVTDGTTWELKVVTHINFPLPWIALISHQVAYAAGTALFEFAEGAMTDAGVLSKSGISADKQDSVVHVILEGGTVIPFVAMPLSGENKAASHAE
uniref:Uncharacterized protein n=1 Tax=Grammatophora oceanica TaxID=210454 RepID=A0A7S1VBN1_9STRA|mmetsp:Transcript_4067/g.5608  ORF Transcript_4067/g.5608 Transcript_4067/m.5608 type:complete len:144 (+) Transcript_4067:514-945(+)|eukprot:CAMPEP_0194070440 /NCGR_PEP_ID=MMETSP0009_2-20130614/88181_1 /TAXON_ID=210454 /ORGANISM="Grammatophora oceanica, Strain CCMP 410" /LENGTH=143 /DNA_ID=CAMNT_0038723709 /DNA_START=321 /DNA_END=752 /DNA_ORIENTATION=+